MGRFVVLFHRTPDSYPRPDHWDFMLEDKGALLTWALLEEPGGGGRIACEQLPDHRLAYLDYEGPVSGDRGDVTRWDAGHFTWLEKTPQRMSVELQGQRLAGIATLETGTLEDDTLEDDTRRPAGTYWFTYVATADR